ncbi:MAG TPA: homogentisate 1,2-dioxygenase [Acidimicrobiales bacterium]
MTYYRQVGEVPPKRHTQFRRPDGGLYAEELMSVAGFSGPTSLLYHRRPPTAVVAAVADPRPDSPLHDPNPHVPRHLLGGGMAPAGDLLSGRRLMLGNGDVLLHLVAAEGTSQLYRNALGDEVVFVRSGTARLESVFGSVDCEPGDYVVVPRSTTHRWTVTSTDPVQALVIEAAGQVTPPARYRSSTGQFLEHSPYCERDLHGPAEVLVIEEADDAETEVVVRHHGGHTTYTYAHHPFDVVGWAGCVYPYRFNVRDFEPITGRVHQPPPVHQTFAGPSFVVCTFVPRLFDYHPEAIPAPYNHSNVDSDEVLYYVEGNFMSRAGAGIGAGSISLHPAGFVHGPQPGSVERSIGATATEELAVMVDTFAPLQMTDDAAAMDDPDYLRSWLSD